MTVTSLFTTSAWAWGPVGHETVAFIAEDNLSPTTLAKVRQILGPDVELADVANWADAIRVNARPETAPWHFIDIEDRASPKESDEPKFCAGHNCVVDQVTLDVAALKSTTSTPTQRLEALKFLVHFVGDLHQPLHCADDADRGGNDKIVRVAKGSRSTKGTKIKLHAYWDHLLEVTTTDDPRELATTLEESITDQDKTKWQAGAAADWAWESFTIAHDKIYSDFPKTGATDPEGVPLPADYKGPKMRKMVDVQLQKAGIRLAFLLNDIFGH